MDLDRTLNGRLLMWRATLGDRGISIRRRPPYARLFGTIAVVALVLLGTFGPQEARYLSFVGGLASILLVVFAGTRAIALAGFRRLSVMQRGLEIVEPEGDTKSYRASPSSRKLRIDGRTFEIDAVRGVRYETIVVQRSRTYDRSLQTYYHRVHVALDGEFIRVFETNHRKDAKSIATELASQLGVAASKHKPLSVGPFASIFRVILWIPAFVFEAIVIAMYWTSIVGTAAPVAKWATAIAYWLAADVFTTLWGALLFRGPMGTAARTRLAEG